MKKKLFLIILLIFTNTFSQEDTNKKRLPPISTDRPDNSDSPYTISKNTFQFETGVNYVSENPLGLSITFPLLGIIACDLLETRSSIPILL